MTIFHKRGQPEKIKLVKYLNETGITTYLEKLQNKEMRDSSSMKDLIKNNMLVKCGWLKH